MNAKIDVRELQSKVKEMYRDVATNPRGSFHFEMGRALAQRLGYPASDLDWVPAEAIESFAGVGHFFHLAALQPGEIVIDLGSGSGTDSFIAALKVGANGRVVGIDMTREQLAKAERLRRQHDFRNLAYLDGYIEETGLEPDTADCVIPTASSISCPTRPVSSMKPRACCGPAGGSRSPTSLRTCSCPTASCATPTCGRHASAAPRNSTAISRQSSAPDSQSARCRRTASIDFFQTGRRLRRSGSA